MKIVVFMGVFLAATAMAEDKKPAGGLDSSVISEFVNRAMPKFSSCYSSDAKSGENQPSGKVITKFVIGADGKVAAASVTNTTLRNPKIESCVTDTIKGIVFPQPEGGGSVEVAYPFEFAPAAKNAEKHSDSKKKKKKKDK